ncbi:MAG: CBS domain-containing protein [Oceanospirillales bacterium]|uniref:Magnesium and cobalt efflux protein CorC n=1 Tax=Marinobacterium halophilum TaxID=267374 RepID=A0A2P8ETE7_9GAMM|nr:transporter associated domain-containing protein [Marinobacterium halophilum]MBR9829830.1 CBS domain-containing protein [Oceanospirillales bacterium]PSL12749.1 magnesium and cobalt transporter [Marinobacterium halophilum]
MSEDRSGGTSKSWLEKLTQAFSDEPRSLEDVREILLQANESGILDNDAHSIIEGAMQVTEMQVRDAMIPRSQMTMVQVNQTPREFLPVIISSAHSRFPVCGENPDEVLGILLAKDLLPYMLDGTLDQFDIRQCLRKATFIPESKRLNVLLNEFRGTRNHMAIVVDEYGGIAGLITIEDVLEQIVGEIEDEHDADDDDGNIKPFDDNGFLVKALTPIEDFNAYFDVGFSDDEFDTIGGIITQHFGHLPAKDEQIDIEGFSFKVLAADNRRLRLLQVIRN